MTYDTLLTVLAAGTRRSILEALRDRPLSVRELTARLPVSQAAVSQHLKRLREAGLVAVAPEGTRRVYRLRREGLVSLRAWIESFWSDVLDAYAASIAADTPATPTRTRGHETRGRKKGRTR